MKLSIRRDAVEKDPFFIAKKQEFSAVCGKPNPGEVTNISSRNLCSVEGLDWLMRGKIIDGKRYLGNGAWQAVDHEFSETNERLEAYRETVY